MPRGRQSANKELDELKKRRQKAQDKGDITEEAKLCNVIGEYYSNHGDYDRALHYHHFELTLSEACSKESIDSAVAHRKVGECYVNLSSYKDATKHHKNYLEIATKLGDLLEQQRAHTTLGRTYFIYSLSELDRGRDGAELLLKAKSAHLESLDVCDKLIGLGKDEDILGMRAASYLNLGLVYENQCDLRNAHKFIQKALTIAKELGDVNLATVLRCHSCLGSLHMKERHPSLALQSYQAALVVAKKLRSEQHQIEVLKEISQVHLEMSNFQQAKSCLKSILKLPQSQLQSEEVEQITRQLKVVRKILYYEIEVEGLGEEIVQGKMELYDKLGDLCCSVNAYSAAIQFYGQLLNVAESHHMDTKKLSPIYVSLARTCTDSGQYSQALHWYNKDLEVWKGNPAEECDTWTSIAKVRDRAGYRSQTVMEAYIKAAELAERTGKVKLMLPQYKDIVKYCRSKDELGSVLPKWERKLSHLLDSHPELAGAVSYSSEEDSQGLMDQDLSDTPPSLPSDESDDEEEEREPSVAPQTRSTTSYAVRRKAKVQKRNEKGETLLHVASIEGNLATVKRLLKEGAEVNARDHCGWLPLHEACNHGNLEVVRILLNNGAAANDPGGPHCDGVTPLIDAATNGHADIVKLLVEKGANVLIKDKRGRTALDVVRERLARDGDDENEEHRVIQDYLVSEMERLGCGISPPSVAKSNNRVSPGSIHPHTSTPLRQTQRSSVGHSRGARRDRSGVSILYSSDEDDDDITTMSRIKRTPAPHKKPGATSTQRTSDSHHLQRPIRDTGSKVLQQTSLPALMPLNDPVTFDDNYPVLDDWLVDDMGEPPAKKHRSSSKEREVQSYIGGPPRRTCTASGGTSGRQNPKGTVRNVEATSSGPSTSDQQSNRGSIQREKSSLTGSSKKQHGNVIELNSSYSDDGFEWMDNDDFEANLDAALFDSVDNALQPTPGANIQTGSHDSSLHMPQRSTTTTTTSSWPPATRPDAPLRVRVKIESKSYLIPCPRQNKDGSHVTIGWLANQAIERYYSEHGGRPRMSLTTMDGAILCSTDPVAHVLGENEEVLGVVEHLPLNERYQMACKNTGIACRQQVLELLQSNTTSHCIDFSKVLLTLRDSAPLFEAIQSEHTLTSLTLTGNCLLRAKGMVHFTSALSKLLHLEELNLSCTGMTAQGLDSLARTSPGPWNNLRTLILSYNQLGAVCGWSLAKLLKQCVVLHKLHLDSIGLSSAVFSETSGLSEALRSSRTLAEFSVAMNKLYPEGIASLFQSLPPSISYLNIGATCSAERPVTEALNNSQGIGDSLESLDISCCELKDEGVPLLVNCLEHCNKLRELKLAGNSITVAGIEPLCKLVSSKGSLRALDMSGNPGLGNCGVLKLLKACTVHGRCYLNLADCGVDLPLPEGRVVVQPTARGGVESNATLNTDIYYKWTMND